MAYSLEDHFKRGVANLIFTVSGITRAACLGGYEPSKRTHNHLCRKEIMSLSTTLAVTGPFVAAVGAALLAYDVLRNPTRARVKLFFGEQQRIHEEIYRGIIDRYRALPAHLDQEVIRSWVGDVNTEMELQRHHLQQRLQASDLDELLFSRRLGVAGLALVAGGSMMQSIAAHLAAG